jgi:hypothetical protein
MPGLASSFKNAIKNWGAPERLAAFAAATGFGISVILSAIYVAAGPELRASLETLFVFLWPSSLLLMGARSITGQAILFVLSAALNAGYFVFLALGAYSVYYKLSSASEQISAAVPAAARAYQAPAIAKRLSAERLYTERL